MSLDGFREYCSSNSVCELDAPGYISSMPLDSQKDLTEAFRRARAVATNPHSFGIDDKLQDFFCFVDFPTTRSQPGRETKSLTAVLFGEDCYLFHVPTGIFPKSLLRTAYDFSRKHFGIAPNKILVPLDCPLIRKSVLVEHPKVGELTY